MPSVKYAEYIKALETNFGADIIEESSYNLTGNIHWLREFAQEYEALDLKASFRIFGRDSSVMLSALVLLKRINTESVLIGYESGDETMLSNCNKGFSLKTSLRATELLSMEGIDIIGAFILGFVGESEKTIDKTIEFARKVHNMGVNAISYSLLTPLPPSKAWNYMLDRKKEVLASRKTHGLTGVPCYFSSDMLDPLELQRDFINAFCHANYDIVMRKLKENCFFRTTSSLSFSLRRLLSSAFSI